MTPMMPMMPMMTMTLTNCLTLLIAVAVAFLIGWLWYGPLFGKAWFKAQPHRKAGEMKNAMFGMIVQVLHLLVMACVVFVLVQGMVADLGAVNAAVTAFLLLGVMTGLGMVSGGIFMGHTRTLILINVGCQLLTLAIFATATILL